MGKNKSRQHRAKTQQNQNRQNRAQSRPGVNIVTKPGPPFQQSPENRIPPQPDDTKEAFERNSGSKDGPKENTLERERKQPGITKAESNESVQNSSPLKIDREKLKSALTALCAQLSTKEISVEVTEDTRKLDAGIVYYIVHIRNPEARRVPTRKTGIYFTKIKDNTIHVQVINGTSMVLLFSNHSGNSQEEVFKYLENMIRKDMEFYQNTLEAKNSSQERKRGYRKYGKN